MAKVAQKPAPKAQARPAQRPPQAQQSRAVATRESEDQVPAHLVEDLAKHSGAGLSGAAEDNLVPLIYLLQALSPQAMRGKQEYIEGAAAGSIWLRNAPEEIQIQDGEEGIVFQHCAFQKDWVEWMPNRGGFVARHEERPEVAEQEEEQGDDGRVRKVWRMPNGNAVVETRYHHGHVYLDGYGAQAYSIPLSSTGHSVSKSWMLTMNKQQHNGLTLPGPAVLWRLRTKLLTKNNQSWHQYVVSREGFANPDQFKLGMTLLSAFQSGEKRVADEFVDDTGGGESNTGDDSKHM